MRLGTVALSVSISLLTACSSGSADVSASGPSAAPLAGDDFLTVAPGEEKTKNLLANDEASAGAQLDPDTVVLSGDIISGLSLEVSEEGILTVTAAQTAVAAQYEYSYTVADDQGRVSQPASVAILVGQPPTANSDSGAVSPGDSVTIDLLANDTVFDGAELDAGSVMLEGAVPPECTVQVSAGVLTLEASTDAREQVVLLTYTVADSRGLEALPAIIDIIIAGGPVAVDDLAGVTPGGTVEIDVLSNDLAPGGTDLDPGTVELTIEPDPATEGVYSVEEGIVTFTASQGSVVGAVVALEYTVRDTAGQTSNPAQIFIVISQEGTDPMPPVAVSDFGTITAGGVLEIDLLANDSADQGQQLVPDTIQVSGTPPLGTSWSVEEGLLEFSVAPTVDPSTVVFIYTVQDTQGLTSNEATILIEIEDAGAGGGDDSLVQLEAQGLDLTVFQPSAVDLRLNAIGGTLEPNADQTAVFLNGARVDPAFIGQSASQISLTLDLSSGLNRIGVIARDQSGKPVIWEELLYSGTRSVQIAFVDEAGDPTGGTATFLTVGYLPIEATYQVPAGGRLIENVPPVALGVRGRNGLSLGVRALAASDESLEVTLRPIGQGGGFQGTFDGGALANWDLTGADSVLTSPGELRVTTSLDEPQIVRHTFVVPPTNALGQPVRQVRVRYRIQSSEVTDGVVSALQDDSVVLWLRSPSGGLESRAHTLRSLGLGTFDLQGGTRAYEFSLPVNPNDTVEFAAQVANAPDLSQDSTLILNGLFLDAHRVEGMELTDLDGGPLNFLSTGLHTGFQGTANEGRTLLGGQLELDPGGQDIAAVQLVVRDSGGAVIFATPTDALNAAIAATNQAGGGSLATGFLPALFQLEPGALAQFDPSDGFVQFQLRSVVGGQDTYLDLPGQALKLRSLPDSGAVRFGSRDYEVGGDGWLLSGVVSALESIPFLYINDASELNAGPWEGRAGHQWAIEFDAWRPGYFPSSSDGAQAILSLFAVPEIGEFIERVHAGFSAQPGDALYDVLASQTLPDGRPALDVILPFSGFDSGFMVRINPSILEDGLTDG